MEQNLLLDAIERYQSGTMDAAERTYFEELRRNNPDIEQQVVEHLLFLSHLNHYARVDHLKRVMNHVEDRLELEGAIELKKKDTRARIVHIWRRYKRTISVAAAAAGIVSILTATGVSFLSESKSKATLTPLVDNKLYQMEYKLNQIEHKLNDVAAQKPTFEANFRATGFLADGKGYIITNAHVVAKARNLIVEDTKGMQYSAVPLYLNSSNDLAILKITDTAFKKVTNLPYTFTKEKADLAEPIFTLGYPREEVVYNEGYLSAKSGYFGDTSAYQITISVNPGNSGGPVLNNNGDIIGIISSKETNSDGVVFAIQSTNIFKALQDIREEKDETIKLPKQNSIKGMPRVQQIKTLEQYVFKVKGN